MKQPIFILHDCLICQRDEELDVGKQIQRVFVDYCKEQGWTPIAPAFSVERLGEEKREFRGYRNP